MNQVTLRRVVQRFEDGKAHGKYDDILARRGEMLIRSLGADDIGAQKIKYVTIEKLDMVIIENIAAELSRCDRNA